MKKLGLSNYIQIGILVALAVIAFQLGSLSTNKKGTAVNQGADGDSQEATAQQPTVNLDTVKSAFSDAFIKFGDKNKKVIFLEISDPSCPYCQIAGGKNKELNSQAGDRFKLVADGGTYLAPVPEMKKLVDSGQASFALIYRNGHGAGEMGMKALYCAFDAKKFWEAKDLIMSNAGYELMNNTVKNDSTKSDVLADFLSSVVDKNTMKKCLEDGKYDDQLNKDTAIANKLGVSGTPGFFVNEANFKGAYSYTDMEPAVKQALGN